MNSKYKLATIFAILAAALYAFNAPISKLLLNEISSTLMASLLYLGAGTGMFIVGFIRKRVGHTQNELNLTKKELPYTLGMIILDIIAPIFLMLGLNLTTSANVSLLNNFEIVATSIIALVLFKEKISKRLWVAIGLITIASIIISIEDISSFSFSLGSLFVILACISWGLENNCTRKLSNKDPLQIVVVKGIFSGLGSLIISIINQDAIPKFHFILIALILGFFSYGLSIYFYIYAQRYLGAAKTSAYYALAPFIGVGLSLIIFLQLPTVSFIIGLIIMIIGTKFASSDVNES